MKLTHPKHAAKTIQALGLDPFLASYHFDGDKLKIEGVSDADIEAAEASLNIALLDKEERNEQANHKRREEYPDIGDQLDAIWKELNNLRMNGENLVSDADSMLGKILAVKKNHPKEK